MILRMHSMELPTSQAEASERTYASKVTPEDHYPERWLHKMLG